MIASDAGIGIALGIISGKTVPLICIEGKGDHYNECFYIAQSRS